VKRDQLRVGLIGVGRMGQNHLRVLSLLAGVDVQFVYDVDLEGARRAASRYGVEAVEDLDAALAQVDAVVIASPTITHDKYLRQAADYVRHIFVEKPLSDTLESTLALQQFAQQRDLDLQIGFIERFNPAVVQMKNLLDNSSDVVSVDFFRTAKISARITDVDVVADLMIHDIDLALYLNGPVTAVAAHGVADEAMIDFASVLLTHANGRFSRIQASRITDKKMRVIQATCRDMFVDCELLRKEITLTRQSEVFQPDGGLYRITARAETLEVPPQEALLTELQAFVSGCTEGPEAGVPGVDDAVAAMRIACEIQQAIYAPGA
jgi:predicted dehydrogenase